MRLLDRFPWLFSRRCRSYLLAGMMGAYCAFILFPIAIRLSTGHEFGGDVAEYLLTAHQMLTGTAGSDRYLFPVLPILYVPISALNLGYVPSYAVADLVSGLLTIALVFAAGLLGYAIRASATAATASAGIVGTFFLTLDQIGWGGQAQILAFALGTVAVAVLTRGPPRTHRFRETWAVGLLLGAAVATEVYAAAYFVVMGMIVLIAMLGRRALTRTAARTYWPVPVIPALSLAFVAGTGGGQAASVATDPIFPHVLSVHALATGFSEIDFGNVADAYACAVLLIVFGAFVLLGRTWTRKAAIVAFAAAAAFVVQVFLLTPAVYWDRAPYFLSFPMAAAVAAMAPARLVSRSEGIVARPLVSRWSFRRLRRTRWVDRAAAVAVAGVLLTQTAVALYTYPGVLSFYSVDAQSISALTWLRGESGGLLMVAPEGLTFPVAYATERPIFPWTQPVWFDTPAERQAAILALTTVAGNRWINAGGLKVADTGYPSNTSSPAVFAYRYPYLVDLFALTEDEQGTPARSVELAATSSGTVRIIRDTTTPVPSFSDNDTLPTYNLTKQTAVLPNGTVQINLTLVSTDVTPTPVRVDLEIPEASLVSTEVSPGGAGITESFGLAGSTTVRFQTSVVPAAALNLTVAAPTETRVAGYPAIAWELQPTGASVGSRASLVLDLRVNGISVSAPQLASELAELSSNDVRWALVDAAAEPALVPRFALDPNFVPYWATPTYTVYRIA